MRSLLSIVAVTLLAGVATAQDAPPSAAPAAEPPVCTTTTVVVKKGDVVLSSKSTTRCDDPNAPGGGFDLNLNPGGALKSVFDGEGPESLTARNASGFWNAALSGSGGCQLMLMRQPVRAGFQVRGTGCRGPLARIAAWRFADGAVTLYGGDGSPFAHLTGLRSLIRGETGDGAALELRR